MKIPKNLRISKSEQIGNVIVSHIEPNFKNGDWIVQKGIYYLLNNGWYCHCSVENEKVNLDTVINPNLDFRKATLKENSECFAILKRNHYIWNGKRLIKRWRAEVGEYYWYLNGNFEIENYSDTNHEVDCAYFKAGNYFQTKQEAEKLQALIQHEIFNKHII